MRKPLFRSPFAKLKNTKWTAMTSERIRPEWIATKNSTLFNLFQVVETCSSLKAGA